MYTDRVYICVCVYIYSGYIIARVVRFVSVGQEWVEQLIRGLYRSLAIQSLSLTHSIFSPSPSLLFASSLSSCQIAHTQRVARLTLCFVDVFQMRRDASLFGSWNILWTTLNDLGAVAAPRLTTNLASNLVKMHFVSFSFFLFLVFRLVSRFASICFDFDRVSRPYLLCTCLSTPACCCCCCC